MRRPAYQQSIGAQSQGRALIANLPAPVGGWNTRDALAAMRKDDAVQLTNFYPSVGEVVLRGGMTPVATGMTGTVKSLYEYGRTDGPNTLFAVTGAGVYDISAGGVVGAVSTALTNGWWNAIQFTNTAGNNFLWGANGVDEVAMYNGTTWGYLSGSSTPAITGVASESLVWPWSHKRRIFILQNNSMTVWYLDTDSIAGTAHPFPVGPLFTRGGYLVSGASWSVDSGTGPDDLWVIITSQGELAIYQGTDVSSPETWALVGVYFVGPPLGRRCFTKFGGDLIVLTEQGAFPLSRALQSASIDLHSAVSDKIQPSFVGAAGLYRGNIGWQGVLYPAKNAYLVNIPVLPDVQSAQYVMNTITGAWCDFSGWNAACFATFESDLYFGAPGGVVFKAWNGTSDNGGDVVSTAQTAFNYLTKSPGLKTVDQFRPLLSYDGEFELRWGMAPDYQFPAISGYATRETIGSSVYWDTFYWDEEFWSVEPTRSAVWRSPRVRPGYNFSLLLQTASNEANLSWSGTDYLINIGAAK